MVHPGFRKRTVILLVVLLIVRFWFGQTFELSGPEAYLWLEGHGTNLSPAYWENGPLVPFLIRIGTAFFGDTELGVRWLAAVICCCTGFVVFYLSRHWFNARSAFWTVVLFIVVPLYAWKFSFMTEATVSTGLLALALIAFSRAVEENKTAWWAVGGAACGLGMLVTIANSWWLVGLVLFFVVNPSRRARLAEPRLWGAILLACVFLAPLLWWWHGAQVADVRHLRLERDFPLSHAFSLNQGFAFVWHEIFYLSPVFFIVLVAILWQLGRRVWDDPRYALLVSLAVPGLIWQNFAAFFHQGHFDLVAPLLLPLLILAGCYISRPTEVDRISRLGFGAIFVLAAAQSLGGLNPFYFSTKGGRAELSRTHSGENVTGFHAGKRQISWRNLADQIQRLQQDEGATLVITDKPTTAAALTFYLPHNQFVYVDEERNVINQFDFWPRYDESASPNDSALFVTLSNDHPGADLQNNFSTVTVVDAPPASDYDKQWNFWSCQRFVGTGQTTGQMAEPMHESESLPKK